MKRKKWMIALCVVLGGVLIFGAAMASATSTSGYDVYKTAFKNTRTATNITATGTVSVSDNGASLLKVDTATKIDQASKSMSGVFVTTSGDMTKTTNVYRQNGQNIIKNSDSDVYQVTQDFRGNKHEKVDSEIKAEEKYAQDIENLVDAVVGNIRSMVVLKADSDGQQQISLQLSGNQIPPVSNAAASLLVKAAGQENLGKHHGLSATGTNLTADLPKLVEGISISSIDLQATVNDQNQITSQQAQISISGKDADGNTHTLVVDAQLKFTDINQTTPDTVDLKDKQVKTMQRGAMNKLED